MYNTTSVILAVVFFILFTSLVWAAIYPSKKTCKNFYKCEPDENATCKMAAKTYQ